MSDGGGLADELRPLAVRYARGVDRRDAETFLGAFAADATLQVLPPPSTGGPGREMRGHDELARVPVVIARYARTYHFLGQSSYESDGEGGARGEVYCIAHHLDHDGPGATDHVMFIRYQDRYRRDETGAFKIAARQVVVDWTETRPVEATGAER